MARPCFWGCLLLVAAVCCLPPLFAGDVEPAWPNFRGTKGDGISSATGLMQEWPTDGPPLLWKSEAIGKGYSSVTMSGSRVFTTGDDGGSSWVYALNRPTGKI